MSTDACPLPPQSAIAIPESSARDPLPLAGRRIGFATSVVGFGGSEVLVADAMEAAARAGAGIVCWCHKDAAIRLIVRNRSSRLTAEFIQWPVANPSAGREPLPSPDAEDRSSWAKNAYRRLTPVAFKRYLGFVNETRAFQAELKRVNPDALFVNVNGSEATAAAGGLWCRSRTIACYHLSFTDSTGSLMDRRVDHLLRSRSMLGAEHIVHTSRTVRDQWCRRFSVPVQRTRIIYSGVDDRPPPDPAAMRRSLGLAEDAFVFCVPGRLDPVKGHAHLLKGVASVQSQLAGAVVVICGEGSLRDDLQQQSQNLGLSSLVKFLGFREDVADLLAAADCAVLPSVASENLSVAILEALMAGTPAIVTRIGGMAEAVRNRETGLVVPAGDASALAQAMVTMASDREALARMSKAAREDAKKRYTRQRMLDEYQTLFTDVVATVIH